MSSHHSIQGANSSPSKEKISHIQDESKNESQSQSDSDSSSETVTIHSNDSESSSSSSSGIFSIKKAFQNFHSTVLEMYSKRKYRKILCETTKNEEIYRKINFQKNLPLTHLKIKCVFEIISKKFIKYSSHSQIEGIEKWFDACNNILEELTKSIPKLSFSVQADQYESLAYYNLKHLFNYVLYYNQVGKLNECLCYLSLCQKLIYSLQNNITYPPTFSLIEEIFLFYSALLISEKNYDIARNVIVQCLYICHKELELLLMNNEDRYKLITLESIDNNKIFFNFSVCFYQLGVVCENKGDIEKAQEAYLNSKWFGLSFFRNNRKDIALFLANVSKQMDKVISLFDIFRQTNFEGPEFVTKVTKRGVSKYCIDAKRQKKFEKVENKIEKLNLEYFDDDDQDLFNEVGKKPKSRQMNKLLGEVNLMNYLMSDGFKQNIRKMKNFEIHRINQDTKTKIQNRINVIKATQRIKINKRLEQKVNSNSNNKGKNETENTEKSTLITNHTTGYMKTSSNFTTLYSTNRQFFKTQRHNRAKTSTNSMNGIAPEKRPDEVPKYNYDQYVFNKNYQKKIAFLENQEEREYKFQMDLLNSKKVINTKLETQDLEKICKDAEFYYTLTYLQNERKIREKEKSSKIHDKNAKRDDEELLRKINYYKISACKSLNDKPRTQFQSFVKLLYEKNDDYSKKSSATQNPKVEQFLGNKNEVENLNKEVVNQLEYDIDFIEKRKNRAKNKLVKIKKVSIRKKNSRRSETQ